MDSQEQWEARKIYVSGPMASMPDDNRAAFMQAAVQLRSWGFDVFNPHEFEYNGDGMPELLWHEYLRKDLQQLLACDGVCLLPGWQGSRGAMLERYVAACVGLDVREFEGWRPQ